LWKAPVPGHTPGTIDRCGSIPDIERRAAAFAARHYGYLLRTVALELGHTDETLEARVANGTFDHPSAPLFRYAGAPRSWQGDAYAAVASGPPGTVAGYMTAAALFGVCPPPPVPHVIVPYGANTRILNAKVHRSDLQAVDRTTIGVIPVTTPARALIDAASVLDLARLCELVDAGLTAGKPTRQALELAVARLTRRPGRKGIPMLRTALEVWAPGIGHDSVAEVRMFRLLKAWRFPLPIPLYVIRDAAGRAVCETDAAWPDSRVALDYDSVRYHGPRRWPRDEQRHAGAEALGWTFVSVDKTDLMPRRPTTLAVGARSAPAAGGARRSPV
jgi:hypothetical protein